MTTAQKKPLARRAGKTFLVLAAIGGLGLAAIMGTASVPFAGTNTKPPAAAPPLAAPLNTPPDMADLVARVGPAVVTIRARQASPDEPARTAPPGIEEFFERFFGEEGARQFRRGPTGPAPRPHGAQSLGSGFIIDPAGHIVTNDHVIGDGDEITVVLQDGRELKARVVGRDAKTDLALLKVDAGEDLPYVSFGPSAKVRVGQWVLTMGNPFGLGQTATAGIISARHRNIGAGPFDDFLQIDAPINQGNSGGPAFNLQGQVIGVNTAIFSPTGGNVGIGFAIPSDLAQRIIEDLRDDGKVARGWLGVQIQEVTPELATSLELDKARGALITRVTAEGPAARAGLKRGDVILGVNDQEVARLADLPKLIAAFKPGSQARLRVWRDHAEKKLTARIGRTPINPAVAAAESHEIQGLRLATLDDQARAAFRIGEEVLGVLIAGVAEGSAAQRFGLARGDVILAVGGDRVVRPADVVRLVRSAEKAKRKAVLLLISRNNGDRFVALPLGKA